MTFLANDAAAPAAGLRSAGAAAAGRELPGNTASAKPIAPF